MGTGVCSSRFCEEDYLKSCTVRMLSFEMVTRVGLLELQSFVEYKTTAEFNILRKYFKKQLQTEGIWKQPSTWLSLFE